MIFPVDGYELPNSNSADLHLTHPTTEECVEIWTRTAASWKDSLTILAYIEEAQYLMTVPLAADGGQTNWILVDKNLPPNQRPILSSCESFRKRALTGNMAGNVSEAVVHGIASVFCFPEYRRRGFAARLMRELANTLRSWQLGGSRCVGSILYSDIGKEFYAQYGWHPNATNSHIVFQPLKGLRSSSAKMIAEPSIAELCARDEIMIRSAMEEPVKSTNTRITVLPDLDHMLWHIRKEEFATRFLFGKAPQTKGAIAGVPGNQVWVVWTRRYYGHPDDPASENVLYILRFVMEGDDSKFDSSSTEETLVSNTCRKEQMESLEAVIQAARAEAAEWRLNHVELWDPSPLARAMITKLDMEYSDVERQEESIASGLWYTEDHTLSALDVAPQWINNEYYAWL